jgi:hypothetical protein
MSSLITLHSTVIVGGGGVYTVHTFTYVFIITTTN